MLWDATLETANQSAYFAPGTIVDAVQAFNIMTNMYNAEYGHTGGGTMNMVMKSGSAVPSTSPRCMQDAWKVTRKLTVNYAYRRASPKGRCDRAGRAIFSGAQIAVIRKWIEQGAPKWASALDSFLAHVSGRNAERPLCLRRLSFDLTGLFPTTADVDAFVADKVARRRALGPPLARLRPLRRRAAGFE